jgi:hypothetical protein
MFDFAERRIHLYSDCGLVMGKQLEKYCILYEMRNIIALLRYNMYTVKTIDIEMPDGFTICRTKGLESCNLFHLKLQVAKQEFLFLEMSGYLFYWHHPIPGYCSKAPPG